MKHSIDEIMLQRCVDGELTDRERCELLAKLHAQGSAENWKTLALSFVEHQVFAKVFAEPHSNQGLISFQLERPSSPPLSPKTSPEPIVSPSLMHRRVRPWFSIAASLLAGLAMGVGAHFYLAEDDETASSLLAEISSQTAPQAASPKELPGAMRHSSSVASPIRTATQTPVMNVRLTGPGGDGTDESVSVPIYSPEQWHSLQADLPHVEFPADVRQLLETHGMTIERERHWYRAPLPDGREILVPADIMRVRHAVQ